MLPLWTLLLALPGSAATVPAPADDLLKSLRDAQERGAFFLAESQAPEGYWGANEAHGLPNYSGDTNVRAAVTAICLNGLRAAGQGQGEAARKAQDFLVNGGLEQTKMSPTNRPYALAYAMMAASREPASPARNERLQKLITETENLANATDAFAYLGRGQRPASFVLAVVASGLEEAKARGAKVPQALLDGLLTRLETARSPSGDFAYYALPSAGGAPMPTNPEDAAARNAACEVALAEGGRGNAGALARSVQCERQNLGRLEHASRRRDPQHPIHDAKDHNIAPYYYLFSLHWTARALSRLPAADARATAEDILASILKQEVHAPSGEPLGIWEDSQEFSGPNYGTGTVLDTLNVLRPYLTRP
ncbi:MAG: hypothetical protein HY923_08330 [Elusimicrobia bacterium]|nr:hypothetical protein [Elusimicrobiota bacterium]